jgi:hypothetical protein
MRRRESNHRRNADRRHPTVRWTALPEHPEDLRCPRHPLGILADSKIVRCSGRSGHFVRWSSLASRSARLVGILANLPLRQSGRSAATPGCPRPWNCPGCQRNHLDSPAIQTGRTCQLNCPWTQIDRCLRVRRFVRPARRHLNRPCCRHRFRIHLYQRHHPNHRCPCPDRLCPHLLLRPDPCHCPRRRSHLPLSSGEGGVAPRSIDSGQIETDIVHLARRERSPVADGSIAHGLELPRLLLRGLTIRQGSEKETQVFVAVAHIPALVADPETADIDATVLGLEIGRVEQPQLRDGFHRINDRLGRKRGAASQDREENQNGA